MNVDALTSMQRALLIPLWSRVKATRENGKILNDPKAVEIAEALGYDVPVHAKGTNESTDFVQVARARAVDDLIAEFLWTHPRATIVNLGCSLNTAFDRLDNGFVRWVDVDLPEIIDLRRRLLPDIERTSCIAGSVIYDAWMQSVRKSAGGCCFSQRSFAAF